ncbi:uncharacterized protein THITE_2114066 [Thermothielavioides terrestris NRRL 8126]|uniref:BTB domain-containing protein n=1 Tax=Thermothielavioides terrestris (strain ATCC 38088 / NRRL 8126) TaxID=578455 RepID=G2R582_THETT|nr:uncharacterized protein THITE_2114066 [Thermothielavioides terrestris NRRL 8126]AEO66165.1 hypothetical protein THITE_2114066 [Thermothielavioides terrestris NRRL 8126]
MKYVKPLPADKHSHGVADSASAIAKQIGQMAQKRTVSYADVLRGHKLLEPAEATHQAEPAKVCKQTQNDRDKATQGSDAAFPPLGQAKKDPSAISPSRKGRKDVQRQPSKTAFSYAEAVKGKSSTVALRPKRIRPGWEVNTETSSPFTKSTAPEPGLAASFPRAEAGDSHAESLQGGDVGDGCYYDGISFHPAASARRLRMRDSSSQPRAAKRPSNRQMHHSVPGQQWAEVQKAAPRSNAILPAIYNPKLRRFSAGATASSHSLRVRSAPLPDASSAPPSATFRQGLPDDKVIEEAIQRAIIAENKRIEMCNQRADRTFAAIAAHDRGEISLWDMPYEWDVLLTCGGSSWFVHHDILCRESDWFRERLPPKDRVS